MRKVIVSNLVSVDGYFEGPGGDFMVMPLDEFFDEYNLERQRTADTLLVGAKTYMGLKGYWPAVAENPAVSPAVAINPELADIHREIAEWNNQMGKVVVSDSLTADNTAPWTDTTTIVRRSDSHQAVKALKEQDGKDIVIFGSHTLWNDLLAAGLVDELHLMVGAAALGGGTPAFESGVSSLRLLDTQRRDGSNSLVLKYKVG